MNAIISELAHFVMNGEAGPRVCPAVSRFGSHDVRSFAHALLMWLKANGRPTMAGRINRRMSPDMPEFIRIVPGLEQLVTTTDQVVRYSPVLRFNSTLPPAEQADLARQADETYKPRVSVTWIVPPPATHSETLQRTGRASRSL